MTAPDGLTALGEKPFSDAIGQLEDLLAQSGRAFLLGAGCSRCAGLPQMAELTDQIVTDTDLEPTTRTVLERIRELFKTAPAVNIEDYLSELIDLLAIADRRESRGAEQRLTLLGGTEYSAEQLRHAVEQIKAAIVRVINVKVSVETHRRFVRAVHRPRRPGKSAADQTVDYLVLNYDTLLEDALALEQLPFADGLEGGATGWWSPTTFDRKGLAARVFKLHGSIDWHEITDDPLPRRIADRLQAPEFGDRPVMIWPASTKYRETQLDPYAELARRLRQLLRPEPRSQQVLVVCGYGFGDAHINAEVDGALRESEGRLTVVVFTSDPEPSSQVRVWTEDSQVHEQVIVYARRGFFHGRQASKADVDLPWWTFEDVTRLLEGDR